MINIPLDLQPLLTRCPSPDLGRVLNVSVVSLLAQTAHMIYLLLTGSHWEACKMTNWAWGGGIPLSLNSRRLFLFGRSLLSLCLAQNESHKSVKTVFLLFGGCDCMGYDLDLTVFKGLAGTLTKSDPSLWLLSQIISAELT